MIRGTPWLKSATLQATLSCVLRREQKDSGQLLKANTGLRESNVTTATKSAVSQLCRFLVISKTPKC
jgi:hypothetical protein